MWLKLKLLFQSENIKTLELPSYDDFNYAELTCTNGILEVVFAK